MNQRLPVNQDLVTKLLACRLTPRERGFVQGLVGRQACHDGEWRWLFRLRDQHKRTIRAMGQGAMARG